MKDEKSQMVVVVDRTANLGIFFISRITYMGHMDRYSISRTVKVVKKCEVPYWDEINKSYLTPIVAQLSGEDNPSAGYISRALFSLVVFG